MNGIAPEDFRKGKLTPAQLLVQDIKLEEDGRGSSRLCIEELEMPSLISSYYSQSYHEKTLPDLTTADAFAGGTRSEHRQLMDLVDNYGWLSCFRLPSFVSKPHCRWIHISSKFPEYIEGMFAGLSNWHADDTDVTVGKLRSINSLVRSNERWSKHGRFFSPFAHPLGSTVGSSTNASLLLSIPFLDWTVYPGPPPPLRFQVDPRETFATSRSTNHPLRKH